MSMKRHRSLCWRHLAVAPYTGSPFKGGVDSAIVFFHKNTKFDGTEPVVIALHGHGGLALSNAPGSPYFAYQLYELARAGYIVVAIDQGGTGGWASPIVETIVSNCITWATSPRTDPDFVGGLGGRTGQVFLWGYSMGGCLAISYAKNHQSQISGVVAYAPAVDMDVFRGISSAYLTEVNSLFATYYTQKTNTAQTLGTSGISLEVGDTSSFPAAGSGYRILPGALVQTAGLFSYTSKDATHLLGATVSSGTMLCSVGDYITEVHTYNALSGYDPVNDAGAGAYASGVYNVPTRVIHGMSDIIVVPANIAAFLTAANNPIISEVQLSGDHTTIFPQMADDFQLQFVGTYHH